MRLEFEPNVSATPLVENELSDELSVSPAFQALLKKGISAAQNGERVQARTLLVTATEIAPRSEDAWMWLASISEYPEELLAFLNHVLDINPDNNRAAKWHASTVDLLAKTLVQRGIEAHNEGSAELAMQCLDQALEYDADCELAWFWKASIVDSDDQRVEFLNRVISINPDNTEAQCVLASITKAQAQSAINEAKAAAVAGNHYDAVDMLQNALQDDPNNVEAWILRSHLSASLLEKLHSLERALEIDPENAAARSSYDFLAATLNSNEPKTRDAATVDLEPAVENVEVSAETDIVDSQSASENVEVSAEADIFDSQPEVQNVDDFVEVAEAEEFVVPTVEAVDSNDDPTEESFLKVVEFSNAEFAAVNESNDEQAVAELEAEEEVISEPETAEFEPVEQPDEPLPDVSAAGVACPFCSANNEQQAFECGQCHAALTLLDIESLLSNPHANHDLIQPAVERMEAERNLREFDENELTSLAIGYFNLHNSESAIKCLQDASRLDSNNVILSGQLNALAIRLDEMRRHDEIHESTPKGRTILVVDDSPTVRKLISGKLEKSGHHVVCANDGVEGLAMIEEQIPDLVLLDIAMPRMDGYEVCRQIRSNPVAKDIPVVMISGKDGFFDKVRGRMAGSTGYITKPFGPETLMKALDTYLLNNENGLSE